MRPRVRTIALMVVAALGALVALSNPALAQPSEGCAGVNETSEPFLFEKLFGYTFNAGETVSLSISGGTATGSKITVNGATVVSSSTNPSTIFYTFPTTQVYTSVTFEAVPTDAAAATITCPAVAPTTPIPTLSEWGLILLGLSLGAAGSWRLIGRAGG